MTETTAQPALTGEQYEILLKYLDDRRAKYLVLLVSDIIGLVLTFVPAAMVYYSLTHREEKYGIGVPNLFLKLAVCFFAMAVFLPALLAHGWQIYYGRRSPRSCVKRMAFSVSFVTVREKEKDTGKHPYRIRCTDGNTYCCPVYLDYKNAEICGQMLGICTDGGSHYIMQTGNVKK